MNKLNILSQAPFIIQSKGVTYKVTWEDFKDRNFKGKECPIGQVDLDLDENDKLGFAEFKHLIEAQDAINARIDNAKPFDHFTNIESPTFFYRIAVGFLVFNDKYKEALVNGDNTHALIAYAKVLMDEKQKEHIDKYGVSIIGVFADDKNHAYTKGGDYALVMAADIDLKILHAIIMEVCGNAKLGNSESDVVYQASNFKVEVDGVHQLLRYKIIEVTNEEVKTRLGKPDLRQVLIGDKNNILPDEKGYDTNFDQTITMFD